MQFSYSCDSPPPPPPPPPVSGSAPDITIVTYLHITYKLISTDLHPVFTNCNVEKMHSIMFIALLSTS